MPSRSIVDIYHAIAADVLDSGADQPAALVLVTEGQRIMIRMPRGAIVRLKERIEATFLRPRKAVSGH